jgi:hypothetical protein
MKQSMLLIGVWSAVLLFLSLTIIGAFEPLYSGSFYPFTLPFIVMAGVVSALAFTGVVVTRIRTALFWPTLVLHGLLFLPFWFAYARWPGGDDGPGMAWGLVIGIGSRIAALLALALATLRVFAK